MGILSKIFKRDADPSPSRGPADDFWYTELRGALERAGISSGGGPVTARTVERIAAVHACKLAIEESVAMVPWSIYDEATDGARVKRNDHPLAPLLRDEPNGMMDSFEFREVMQRSLLESGNAYAFISRSRSRILELIPLDYERVDVKLETGNRLVYEYRDPKAGKQTYGVEDIFHIRYLSRDGIKGRSPVDVARDSFAFAQNALKHGNNVFDRGAFLAGMLVSPHAFKDDESREKFMSSFHKLLGSAKFGKFGLLEQGVDYKPFSMTNKDAQFIEARDLSITDIARIFRVPPIMIQVTQAGMSYASVEQLAQMWVQYTILPWVTRWEYAVRRQLLGKDRGALYARANVSALLRGDLKSRTEAIVSQLQYGLKTINEARRMLDDNDLENPLANEAMVSHNLIPLSRLEQKLEQEAQGADANLPAMIEPEEEQAPPPADESARFRPLFCSLLERLRSRERGALEGASRRGSGFDRVRWAAEWLSSHRDYVTDVLAPAFTARFNRPGEATARRFAVEYTEILFADLGADPEAWSRADADSWAARALQFDYVREEPTDADA